MSCISLVGPTGMEWVSMKKRKTGKEKADGPLTTRSKPILSLPTRHRWTLDTELVGMQISFLI